MGYVT